MLNELFARFDRLAEVNFNCIIRILSCINMYMYLLHLYYYPYKKMCVIKITEFLFYFFRFGFPLFFVVVDLIFMWLTAWFILFHFVLL